MTIPSGYEIIAQIKELHNGRPSRVCPECNQRHPCKTFRHVDAILASRFDAPAPAAQPLLRDMPTEDGRLDTWRHTEES